MKTTLLGCGRWASFLAWYSARLGHNVLIWGREESERYQSLKSTRKNEYVELQDNIQLTSDLEEAINFSQRIIISINAQNLRELCGKIKEHNYEGKTFILNMKGIEISTGMRLSQVVEDVLGDNINVCVWVGPGHAEDFTRDIPNCMVVSSKKDEVMNDVVNTYKSNLIRFYKNDDLIGVEIGAAAKNVVGIAAGILDGLNLSSLKGALMSRGVTEVARLITAMGGKGSSSFGLSHLGDYEATLFSAHSHNRSYGENLVKDIKTTKLAEGVYTSEALLKIGKKLNVDLPITNAIYNVIYNKVCIKSALDELFNRELKNEIW
ncbi:glycerol-3-phosphate dehydrogenase (NAD(P)+) [Hathewaya proteolytica DSM 3090]|uniref:Glycerol-3-phosphate dehydrogenase n=1 Tax=Hathewaya proteolytica DSM 3090 TaxID=1121331 RepID=A0A1M6NYC2_9CLOT|nr:glycerol-3-phosphate dehydrogenase (NAD(P)+) [Hathewaya proteolytica DSM 3090]